MDSIKQLDATNISDIDLENYTFSWMEKKRSIIANVKVVLIKATELNEICVLMHQMFDQQVETLQNNRHPCFHDSMILIVAVVACAFTFTTFLLRSQVICKSDNYLAKLDKTLTDFA